MKFEELGLNKNILQVISKMGYTEPTQIQEKSIPAILQGKDVIGESATGSGKTFAFAVGILERVKPKHGVQALVLTPTRELAEQVREAVSLFNRELKVISVYGGVSMGDQIYNLKTAEVVVATPGRLLDHLNRQTMNLNKINILVLDEVDRMFDMGFIDDINEIIRLCPRERQTLFFSATISGKIKSLTARYMKQPLVVSAESDVDPSKLKQVYYDVPRNVKIGLLCHLLSSENSGLVMVFCNSRRTADFVETNLNANGIKATAIHGGFSQNKRTKTMEMFHGAKFDVLVCTDVAARGLHIENVSHIYNYEIPNDARDYKHRIGRTARAGKDGKVINFLCDYDYQNFSKVQSDYRQFKIERVEAPQIPNIKIVKAESGRNDFNRNGPRGRFGGNRSGGSRGGSRFGGNRSSSGSRFGGNRSGSRFGGNRSGGISERPFQRRSSGPRRD